MEKVKESTLKYFGVNIWTRYCAHFAGDCVHPLERETHVSSGAKHQPVTLSLRHG